MSEVDYKEAPFSSEADSGEIPVKVHIIAPSTLPEGYVFEAEVGTPGNKKTISVEVVRPKQLIPAVVLMKKYYFCTPTATNLSLHLISDI